MQRKQVSEQLGIDIETLRYYEKIGLISNPQRLSNGYRQYNSNHIIEIKFIQHCRSLGISIEEIKVLKNLTTKPKEDCSQVNQIIEKNLSLIEQKIKDLKKLRAQLKTLLESCLQTSTLDNCKIVKSLNKAASEENCACHKKKKGKEKA